MQHNPIRGFHKTVGRGVDLRRVVERLPDFGDHPFAGDFAAVEGQPRLIPLAGDFVEPVGFGLGRVVLPEFDPSVGVVAPLGVHTERAAVRCHGQHCAGGEVRADADHILGAHIARAQNLRDRLHQHVDVILGILQGEVQGQGLVAAGQMLVNHPVAVGVDSRGDLPSAGHVHQHCPPRFGAVVHADGVFVGSCHNSASSDQIVWQGCAA
ncbi:MAG: hypothetical protein JW395_2348 [Nitrospira sp.]|nr:hypothetical protein [Nitrospira sp.]